MAHCTANPEHRARLHLKNVRISETKENGNHLQLSMQLESCPDRKTWKQTQCIVPLKRYQVVPNADVLFQIKTYCSSSEVTAAHSPDLPVHSICRDIQHLKVYQIFAIELCGDTFLNGSKSMFGQSPEHPTEAPMISLSQILDRGILKEKYTFLPNDKKILAYILSQALLNLYNGPWIQNLWTSENIFFPYDTSKNMVYDIHHPYVLCTLSQKPFSLETLDSQHDEPLILSFAKLLIELETGERVMAEEGPDGPDFLSPILTSSKKVRNDLIDPRYGSALDVCVNFPKFYRADRKENLCAEEPFEHTVHDTILNHIVEPLRENIDSSRASEWGLRVLDLNAPGATSDGQSATANPPQSFHAVDPLPSNHSSGKNKKNGTMFPEGQEHAATVKSGHLQTSSSPQWKPPRQIQHKERPTTSFPQRFKRVLKGSIPFLSNTSSQSRSSLSPPDVPVTNQLGSSIWPIISARERPIQHVHNEIGSTEFPTSWVSRDVSESAVRATAGRSILKRITKARGTAKTQNLAASQRVESPQST